MPSPLFYNSLRAENKTDFKQDPLALQAFYKGVERCWNEDVNCLDVEYLMLIGFYVVITVDVDFDVDVDVAVDAMLMLMPMFLLMLLNTYTYTM